MADPKIKCQCGLSILVEWRPATSAATYLVTCPQGSAGHEVVATPPIRVRRMDASGKWECRNPRHGCTMITNGGSSGLALQ
jgi:hypothetical protein